MNFWRIFIRVLPWRPLGALRALWWQIMGRRVRARNRLRSTGGDLPFAYDFWMRNIERQEAGTAALAERWQWKPTFAVIVDARAASADALRSTLNSVRNQLYSHWSLLIVGEVYNLSAVSQSREKFVSRWREAICHSVADFIVPVAAGDQLSGSALINFARALQGQPEGVVVYGDEDEIDRAGRRSRPFFKPRWNRELFLAKDYISHACAIRATSIAERGSRLRFSPHAEVIEILLEVTANGDERIVHVPKILMHRGRLKALAHNQPSAEAVERHVAPGGATAIPGPFDSVKVSWPLPSELPLVSIIVPTRDKLKLLRACVESIVIHTTYSPIELLIVDNRSGEEQTLRYLDTLRTQPNIRVLSYPGDYNYSAINNFAAREAKGTFVCLLNNDTEVLEANWLSEMMRYGVRGDIGAVGAKLLYSDRTIQHAGVIVGMGNAAGHAHRNLPSEEPGYFSLAHVPQFVSAVTGACLLVEKRKYFAVGGLDEESLPIAYNDVDFCLKLERAGWQNVYVPHAVLLHHESKSRAKDTSPRRIEAYQRELKIFQERWGAATYRDPLLNPNLDRSSETFVIQI